MTIKVYICEDEAIQRKQIEQAVINYNVFSDWNMELTLSTDSAETLLAGIDRSNQWNVYFLDVNLEESAEINNGLVLAQEIRKFDPLGFIVFITIRSELSFLTFQYRVAALDFIVKSYHAEITERINSCLKTVEARLEQLSSTEAKSVKLNIGSEISTFFLKDILYFSANKTHIIHLHGNEHETLVYQETLNALEENLKEDFIRCHRSFLVNRKAIDAIATNYSSLTLLNGDHIPVSVRKKPLVKEISSSYPVIY